MDGEAATAARWWEGRPLLNGVFKGGGARGVAYAGALVEVEARGHWFGAVAGASAGAITASLVAAGAHPDRLGTLTNEALRSIGSSTFGRKAWHTVKMAVGVRDSVFTSGGLADWLAATLRDASGVRGSVTFEALYIATSIDLFIVTLDLVTRTPLVFNHRSTPRASVPEAVVASCAIPGAFNPGRAVVDGPHGSVVVHRLVDGGAWANYPDFIFRDPSFFAWLTLAVDEAERDACRSELAEMAERTTIGFLLGSAPQRAPLPVATMVGAHAKVPAGYDLGIMRTTGKAAEYLVSRVLGTRALRVLVLIAILIWGVGALGGLTRFTRLASSFSASLPAGVHVVIVLFLPLVVLFVLLMVLTTSVVVLGAGRALTESVIPAGRAALGVATGVAPWAGVDARDHVVVIDAVGVKTTDFGLSQSRQQAVIKEARSQASDQLDRILPEAQPKTFTPTIFDPIYYHDGDEGLEEVGIQGRAWAIFGTLSALAFAGFGIATGAPVLASVCIIGAILFGVPLIMAAAHRARSIALGLIPSKKATAPRWAAVAAAVGIAGTAMVSWAVLDASKRIERSSGSVFTTTIDAAERTPNDIFRYRYTFSTNATNDAGHLMTATTEDDVQLAVGEKVLVRHVEGKRYDLLVRNAGDFVADYGIGALGLVLLTVALQQLLAIYRIRRLLSQEHGSGTYRAE